jgi:hypothetical protein
MSMCMCGELEGYEDEWNNTRNNTTTNK